MMDLLRFSMDVKHVIHEASHLRNQTGRAYKYDLVILFARIWLLKAEIFIKKSSTPLTISVEDFSKALHERSEFLQKAFSRPVEKTECQIVKLIEEIPGQVESLYQSSDAEDLVGNRVRGLLFKFLVQVMLFKAEALLFELLKNEASLMLPLKSQIGILHEGLILLIKSEINQPGENTENEKVILTEFEGVATGVISLCNSCPSDKVTEEAVKNMEFQLSDMLAKVQLLKAKLKGLYLKIPSINIPWTPGLDSIKFLLQYLRQLLSREHDSVASATHQIEVIRADLEFIMSTYGHAFYQSIENLECNNIHTWLVNTAHQVEYVIDSMVLLNDSVWQHLLWLYHLSDEITHIKMRLAEVHEKSTYNVVVDSVRRSSMPLVSHVTRPWVQEEVIVGFNHDKMLLFNRLVGTRKLDIVSIVGMAGIGKTTLANYVFNSRSVVHHFHMRAWCHVSETYKKRELLLNILAEITELTDVFVESSDEDLRHRLYRCLKGTRYLIVMDDVWSTEAWDYLRSSFPDDSNGSRILITSRLYDVVPIHNQPHILHQLSEDESWELLKTKIFGGEECPEDLLEVGNQIAKSCKGLPAAIGIVAGLLHRINMSKDSWEQIAESVSSMIANDTTIGFMDILGLSYQHLPDYLKVCFLYFGAFPKDEDIPVRKLSWLWIAEGFIPKMEHKSLEDLAEGYLMDLIGRSLVIPAKRRSNGKVKTCRVHDLVLNLCMIKARDAKFLQLISSDEHYFSVDGLCYGLYCERHRLFVHGDQERFISCRPSGPYVRSLVFLDTTEMYPGCFRDVSFISNNFKLLKVLDLESVNIGNSLENGIDLLVLLRYLAVGGEMDSIPSSLSKLQNLETLVVKSLMTKVVLPDTLWSMTKLRHVHVTKNAIFTLPDDKNASFLILESLQTLSLPSFPNGEETNNIILRFPNIRKLKCIFLESRDVSMNSVRLPILESLRHLESLNILYYGRPMKNGGEWYLPSSLKKLSLSNFRMPWNHISAIGRLPNLEVLKLTSGAFDGTRWEMTEGEFLELMYLKLDTLNLVHWDASWDHLPCLEHLELRNCKQLKEVPSDFAGIWTLQKIVVHQCGVSVEQSVKRIVEESGQEIHFTNAHS